MPTENDMNVKSIMAASLLAIGLSVTAMAQSETPSFANFMTADHSMRSSRVIGMPVYNENHEKIGTVDDILLPANGGEVTAVLSVGGFLGVGVKMINVPLSHVHFEPNHPPMMPASKPALMSMPKYSYDYAG
jgi:sporulation protein YlmC with PRC-barrel domain